MLLRLVNRVLAALLGLALVALAVVTVGEVVLAALGHAPWVIPRDDAISFFRAHQWRDFIAFVVCLAVAVVGLLLLLWEIKPRRPRRLALQPLEGGVTVTASRRNLQRTLREAALSVDGIDSAKVKLKRRVATVKVATALREPDELEQRLDYSLDHRIDALAFARPPRLRVKLKIGDG